MIARPARRNMRFLSLFGAEWAMLITVLVFLRLEQVTWLNTLPFIATIQSRDLSQPQKHEWFLSTPTVNGEKVWIVLTEENWDSEPREDDLLYKYIDSQTTGIGWTSLCFFISSSSLLY